MGWTENVMALTTSFHEISANCKEAKYWQSNYEVLTEV